jgi:hypothetical protein
MLTQRVEKAHAWLDPQLTLLTIDGEHNRPGHGPAFHRRRNNVRTHRHLTCFMPGCL